MVKVAVLGYGTVGSGIVEVIRTNREDIYKRIGDDILVSHVLDLREFVGDPIREVLVHDFDIIANDESVNIVAEAMGGIEPAYTFAKIAINKGKHFCTSNKELVAKHGAELIKLAKENNVSFLFEASVAGGIPEIRPLISSLASEKIVEITGILNGTTNYMMTKMSSEGMEFNDVLEDAQEKGYAERNPEADIEGYDACRKIAILASLAFGKQVDFEDIYTQGISRITSDDIDYAKAMNKNIKLLSSCTEEDGKISAMVAPMLIGKESPLYGVSDVNNAVFIKGNMLGDTMFYGPGAGKLPTASAVVSDIIEEAKNLDRHIQIIWDEEKLELNKVENIKNAFFVRVCNTDNNVNEKVKNAFGNVKEINIDKEDEYAFVTNIMSEGEFKELSKTVGNIINYIRVKN